MGVEVPAELPQDVRHLLAGGERLRVLGAERALPAPRDPTVLAQRVVGAAGAAESVKPTS